jgi:hypothetical protein
MRGEKRNPAQLTIWDQLRRQWREQYRASAVRRRAQRLASHYGESKNWRLYAREAASGEA